MGNQVKKDRGFDRRNKETTSTVPGSNVIGALKVEEADSVFTLLKQKGPTVANNPNEVIVSRGMSHMFGPHEVFQAHINNEYYIMLHAKSLEKMYLNGSSDEFIISGSGKEAYFAGRKVKFVTTNKTGKDKTGKDNWIMIDVNTLEKVSFALKDDPSEFITNRPGRGEIKYLSVLGRNIMPVYTNKSSDKLVLIDVDTLEKVSLHVKDHPEENITSLFYSHDHILGRPIIVLEINDKFSMLYLDNLEKITIKDSPNEVITSQERDFGMPRDLESSFNGRPTAKFNINYHENNSVILYLDTLEKVTIKDCPEDIITHYTSVDNHPHHDKLPCLHSRDVVIANINNDHKSRVLYLDTIEKVTLADRPNDFITGIRADDSHEFGRDTFIQMQINHGRRIYVGVKTIKPLTLDGIDGFVESIKTDHHGKYDMTIEGKEYKDLKIQG